MTKKDFKTEALATINSLQEDVRNLQIRRIQGDFWLLFAREMMQHLPKSAVQDSFLDTRKHLIDVLGKSNENYPNLGPYAQDAMLDWTHEVNKMIESLKD